MPTVSVNMCVHNGEKYLTAAIDSTLKQTFRDFEFIIVDDGYTDDTGGCTTLVCKLENTFTQLRSYIQ